MPLCEGCGCELGIRDLRWMVCMDCTKARHRAVVARKGCTCGRKAKLGEPKARYGVVVRDCARCLSYQRVKVA